MEQTAILVSIEISIKRNAYFAVFHRNNYNHMMNVFHGLIQDIDNQLQLATESFLEGDDCTVDMNKREVQCFLYCITLSCTTL